MVRKKAKTSEPITSKKGLFGDYEHEIVKPKKMFMKTISTSLNRALSLGGIPAGCICEIYGQNGRGKSVLSALICASATEQGHYSCIIESEKSIDFDWYESLGVDWNETKWFRETEVEPCFKKIYSLMNKFRKMKEDGEIPEDKLFFIILDTISVLCSEDEEEDFKGRGFVDKVMKLQKILNRLLNKVGDDISFICINQVRDNMKKLNMYDADKISWGANAFKHNVSLRIQTTGRAKEFDNSAKDLVTGHKLSFIVEKCKNVGVNEQKGKIFISNGYGNCPLGYDDVKEAVEEAIDREKFILKTSSTKYSIDFLDLEFVGLNKLHTYLRNNEDALQKLKDLLNSDVVERYNNRKNANQEPIKQQQEVEEEKKVEEKTTRRSGRTKKTKLEEEVEEEIEEEVEEDE